MSKMKYIGTESTDLFNTFAVEKEKGEGQKRVW